MNRNIVQNNSVLDTAKVLVNSFREFLPVYEAK